jgi:hypothetical protein
MMPAALAFRLFIVTSVLLAIFGGVIDAMFPDLLPEPLRKAQDALYSSELRTQDILLIVVGLPILAGGLVSVIGLYQFRPWAPRLALFVTIATLPLYPLVDAQAVSTWSMLLSESSAVLWGVVLAMAFLPPVADRFKELHANSTYEGSR